MGTKAAEYVSRTSIGAYFHSARESRKLVLVIVAIALLLDNMLLTTVGRHNESYQIFSDKQKKYFSKIIILDITACQKIIHVYKIFSVPIIPEFLYHVRHRYDYLTTTTTPPTVQLDTEYYKVL